MMSQYHVYSDASGAYTHNLLPGSKSTLLLVAYCYRIIVDEKPLTSQTGVLPYENVTAGEIQAANEALKLVPSDADVVVHTDLASLSNMLEKSTYRPKQNGTRPSILCDAVAQMKGSQAKFESFVVDFRSKNDRSDHYRFCHKRAHRLAKKCRKSDYYKAYLARASFRESMRHFKLALRGFWLGVQYLPSAIKRIVVQSTTIRDGAASAKGD